MRGLPGLKARGYVVETGPGPGAGVEHETFTCCHCNNLTVIPHRATPDQLGRFCMSCNQMTCAACGRDPECRNFMRKLERQFARARLCSST